MPLYIDRIAVAPGDDLELAQKLVGRLSKGLLGRYLTAPVLAS